MEKDADPRKLDLSRLPQTAKEMKARLEEEEKENRKYNENLRARAKTPEQLTEGLECVVQEVNSYQSSTSFTPRSEMVIGGQSPSYRGVMSTAPKLKFTVAL